MTGNELRQRIRLGKRVYGSLIVSDSARWLEVIGNTSLDYVFIDLEHISLERKTVSWMCQGYRLQGIPPVVRIPSPDPYEATKALDAGACGILAPYIETVGEVEGLIAAVKTRPLKGSKVRDYVSGKNKPESPLKEYLVGHNSEHMLLVNIESRTGVENLGEMLSYDEVDGIVIGPHDLSCSYDIPEAYEDPRFVELVSSIIKKARSMGKGAGIHMTWQGNQQEIQWAKDGANIILHKADIIVFAEYIRKELDGMRDALGENADKAADKSNINI